jgi:hypothetical protein
MMDDMTVAMAGVKSGISLLSDAIGLVRKTKDLLPESQDKEAIEQSLAQADNASKLAEAQIAQALGYTLCKCTFPPQIMLSSGYKLKNYSHREEYICPTCSKSSISPKNPTPKVNRRERI